MTLFKISKAVFLNDLRIFLTYKFNFILTILSIFIYIFFLSKFSSSFTFVGNEDEDLFYFLFIGLVVVDITITCCSTPPLKITFYQTSGIMEELISDFKTIYFNIISSIIFPFLFALVKSLFYFIFLGIFNSGIEGIGPQSYSIIAILPVYLISLLGICLLASSFTILFKRGNPITQINNIATAILGGAFYPVDQLSINLAFIANLIPGKHMIDIARNLFSNKAVDLTLLANSLFWLTSIGFLLLLLGSISFYLCFKHAKLKNTITSY